MLTALPFVVIAGAGLVGAKSYNLHQYSGGQNFFDSWNYPGTYDFANNAPTPDTSNSGDNWIANKTYSQSAGLTTVNSAGYAVLRVDDTNQVVFNDKRYSVRIESSELYGVGSVFVLDAVHAPFGCSVWPAYWTTALQWPEGGEIDILEGVNQAANNQMALHTNKQCTVTKETVGATMSGQVIFENCGDALDGNRGCIVRDDRPQSFGTGFNDGQGGMWVTELAEEGISIWFFPRSEIPAALTSDSNSTTIDTSTLGKPTARYSSATCDIKSVFAPQKIVINITLCGVFARPTFNDTCPATRDNACYLDWVIGPPANYTNAFFEIVSHRVFTDSTSTPTPTGGNGSGGSNGNTNTGNTGGGNGVGGGNNNNDNTGAGSRAVAGVVFTLSAALLAAFAIAL